MAPAPASPSPDSVSLLAQALDFARDWAAPLLGGGVVVWLFRVAQWKRDIERTQGSHGERIAALETANAVRDDSHNRLAVAVAKLPDRDEVREMISELRADVRAFATPRE